MSMFFRYDGYLSFENDTDAKKYYQILTTDADSWFSAAPNDLELVGQTIKFKKVGNFNSYNSCQRTLDLMNEAARNAKKGSIKVDEGDGEDNLWNKTLISVASLRKEAKKLLAPSRKTYVFSGELEFENEEKAKEICKSLLTDSKKSVFSKFERLCEGDKRKISFHKKKLIIDSQYTVDDAFLRKTEKLLKKASSESINGKIEIKEINGRTFYISDADKKNAPDDWVNDMNRNVFYRASGSILFHSTSEAETAQQKLLSDEKSIFSITGKSSFPIYISNQNRLVFDDINSCARKMLNDTSRLISEIASSARSGKVTLQYSYIETMDTFVADRIIPSKVRKWIAFENRMKQKSKKSQVQ